MARSWITMLLPIALLSCSSSGPGTVALASAPWVEMPPYRWLLTNTETGVEHVGAADGLLDVEPGDYRVVWHQSEHQGRPVPLESITVTPGDTTRLPIGTGLRLLTPDGWQPPYQWSLVTSVEASPAAVFSGTLEPRVVPQGTFRLIWRQTEHGASDVDMGAVTISAGTLNELTLDSGLELLVPEWLPPDFRPYYYHIDDGQGTERARWSDLGPQLAPPGEYALVFRQSEHAHVDIPWGSVTVPADGIVQAAMDSGVRFVPTGDTAAPYKAFFLDLVTGAEYVWNGGYSRGWDPVVLPPGRYRVDWWQTEHGSERMTLRDEIEVVAGALTEIQT